MSGKIPVTPELKLAGCQKGLKVRFTTVAALVHECFEA